MEGRVGEGEKQWGREMGGGEGQKQWGREMGGRGGVVRVRKGDGGEGSGGVGEGKGEYTNKDLSYPHLWGHLSCHTKH